MSWFTGKDGLLEAAIDADNGSQVEESVRAGANVNAKGLHGVTPLEYAIDHLHKNAYQALLRLGADPSLRDDRKENATTLATGSFARDPDYLLGALRAGADPNTRRPDGDPIIVRFLNDRNLDAITVMSQHGADLDLRNRSGDPLVISAAIVEFWDVVWRLLQLGAKYDYTHEPFSWAQILNRPKVTPPDSPLWPYKVRTWTFLHERGISLPSLPGADV
jgi:uncharacterized protein